MTLEMFLMVLRGISTLLDNPQLGHGSIGAQRGSELLSMLATLVEGGTETEKELLAFAEDIKALVAANGSPSRGQWEAMQARDQAARAALEANKAALENTEEPPPKPATQPPQSTSVQGQGGTQPSTEPTSKPLGSPPPQG